MTSADGVAPGTKATSSSRADAIDERRAILVAHLDLTSRLRGRVVPADQIDRALSTGVTYNRANLNLTLDDRLPEDPVLPSTAGDFATVGVAESMRDHPTDPSLTILFSRFAELDGTPWAGCPRSALERQQRRLHELGLGVLVGFEQEGYLVDAVDDAPLGWREFSAARSLSAMSPFRDALFTASARAGVPLGQFSKEMGPHQFEFNLPPREPTRAAEDLIIALAAARDVATRSGYRATFMPRPWHEQPSSGLHVHLSLHHHPAADGEPTNAMWHPAGHEDDLSDLGRSSVAGILDHARGLAFLAMPTVNSYQRLEVGGWTPLVGAWSVQNRDALVRFVGRRDDRRIEFRGADGLANPYLLLAGLLGLMVEGIEANRVLDERLAIDADVDARTIAAWDLDGRPVLPITLDEAIRAFEADPTVRSIVPAPIDSTLLQIKRNEWEWYRTSVGPAERTLYLETR